MARFPTQWLDDLRSRLTLSAVIARDVSLVRAGREQKGCCPFHDEATPSFTVNDEKGFAHCFGCGWHGDVIRFVMDLRGTGFVEVCETLAGEAGLAVPARSAEAEARVKRIEGMRPTLEEAARLFAERLARTPAPAAWVHERGLDAATIAEFGLGWAPEDGGLAGQGFNRRDLMAVGLVGVSTSLDAHGTRRNPFYYPRFRSRIMVPIHDARGRIVGFGGRAGPGAREGAAKYVNSVDSEIFDKGGLLFNLHRARDRLRAGKPGDAYRGAGRLVLVEGYMDAIALHRAGMAAAAPMGTALTERQLELAWRSDHHPLLLFDGDAAGAKAAVRACETALPLLGPGRELAIGTLPEGLDPDDVVRAARAAGEDPGLALAATIAEAGVRSPQSVLADAAFAAVDADAGEPSPEHWAQVWAQLSTWGAAIGDEQVRQLTMMRWRRRWEVESALSADNVVRDVAPALMTLAVDEGLADATQVEGGDDRLHRIIARLLDLRRMRAETNTEIRACLAIAKIVGFDKKQINARLREIEMDEAKPGAREEEEAIALLYRRALNIRGPMTEALMPPPFDVAAERAGAVQARKLSKTMLLIGAAEAVEGMR